jgi:hypothetical protein
VLLSLVVTVVCTISAGVAKNLRNTGEARRLAKDECVDERRANWELARKALLDAREVMVVEVLKGWEGYG